MCIYEVEDKKSIEKLFEGWEETLIWSCLQDCMGTAYSDDMNNPRSAKIIIGDFCFFAGEPQEELALHKPEKFESDFLIMISENDKWGELIEKTYGSKARKYERYAIKKERDVFDKEKLQDIVKNLKAPYEVKMIDENIYNAIKNSDWAGDLCSQFKDYKDYELRGLGAAVLKNGKIVSGASSYTVYNEGIEIEIDTRKDERRKGLALVCGAKLILECLKRNLYPSWDAQNKESVCLAEKLGYHFDKSYTAYEVILWPVVIA